MDFSEKHEKLIEGVSAAGIGFVSFVKAATMKWESSVYNQPGGLHYPYSLLGKHRIEDALAGIVGGDNVRKMDSTYDGAAKATMNPLAILNKITIAGIAVVIADSLLNEVPQYRNLPAVSSIVKGAGLGAAIGGAIGGFFDPEPPRSNVGNPYTGNPNPQPRTIQYTYGA